ncbi:biotin-dependent carboxyltransferase family protein [Rhodoblastus acidophilus]|uniref:Biotin-dependent carboxyltransferase family protein n=1 Tax=Candidatus Rhodoblastus alkanivorans TaxID=2954117 RepID=A0ABS9Z8S8_9HYPH|nr:biotin-dependent carboxyltransferase family protein [Candidatus Rhodoblastus alkanivorans]MCI4677960.1 biotin-dependent carboxyltransferase family protein [Candidatus Rhodoblastus alkanivorans]MCI4683855.1 biotin-dependent carboxyltransferase family protein [Candidatus Rhodoblastus alkanivorans]MDI4641173.1 biotin-dependent carboxyltransferase family protein [Rhodoblastus acidophilus]
MKARVVVERPGAGVTVQDFGRKGYRALGVAVSGALDARFLAAANALAGAPDDAAGLEILLAAPELRVVEGAARIGLAGDFAGAILRADGRRENVASWRGLVLREGDALTLKLGRGPAYLGFSGGLDLPEILGARSTFSRAGFGGIDGRALAAGDVLPCGAAEGGDVSAPPLVHETGPIRFIPGPQADHFPPETLALFSAAPWRVGADSDRMGLRLSGPRLAHSRLGANIVSDGATPGAIQVPGDGQPIVLRADCQTSGGYAKIGCAITADLPRLAHLAPGDVMRFAPVDHAEAAAARREGRERFAQWRVGMAPAGECDDRKLWTENLISGATSGD